MARARNIRGIKVKAPLRDNARRIVDRRLDELLSWRDALGDPSAVRRLHDMRIAAKRLRYALEMFEVCFPLVKPSLKGLTDIQERIGDIHDLDVMTGLMRTRLQAFDREAERAAVEIMSSATSRRESSIRLRTLLSGQGRDRARLGLLGLIAGNLTERDRKFVELQTRWGGTALDAFAAELRMAVAPPQEADGTPAEEDSAHADIVESPRLAAEAR